MPQVYENETLIPVGYPIVSGYNKVVELRPEKELHSVILKEEAKYLKYRAGKKYKLYYYDRGWKLIAEKAAEQDSTEMKFDNIPKNALLILIPEYSEKKERPFNITDEGERFGW